MNYHETDPVACVIVGVLAVIKSNVLVMSCSSFKVTKALGVVALSDFLRSLAVSSSHLSPSPPCCLNPLIL